MDLENLDNINIYLEMFSVKRLNIKSLWWNIVNFITVTCKDNQIQVKIFENDKLKNRIFTSDLFYNFVIVLKYKKLQRLTGAITSFFSIILDIAYQLIQTILNQGSHLSA